MSKFPKEGGVGTVTTDSDDQRDLLERLHAYLTPSKPIRQEEFLRGRSMQLQLVQDSLRSPGRNVFIYGDRGVGKSSLAQTAAYMRVAPEQEPVILACDSKSTFARVIREVTTRLLHKSPLETKRVMKRSAKIKLSVFSATAAKHIEEGKIPETDSVNEAVSLLSYAGEFHSRQPVVVIDEFDRLTSSVDKQLFGDLIHQLADQAVPAEFIFCGVGASLEDLLAKHSSAERYLAAIRLDRLRARDIMEITDRAASALSIRVGDEHRFRIGTISDGFPHYAHLIGLHLFETVIRDSASRQLVRSHHFKTALDRSAKDVEPRLRSGYRRATEKYSDDYKLILWALADHPDVRRRSADVYNSYQRICRALRREPLDRPRFNARINALKTDRCGKVIGGTRTGWYEFSEPMMRAYCRLVAEEDGLSLGGEI
jgi:hypothetical protein